MTKPLPAALVKIRDEKMQEVYSTRGNGVTISYGNGFDAGAEAMRAYMQAQGEGRYEKLWKDFVSLQRGDVQEICKEAERYRTMQAEMDKLVLEMEHALKYYESCGEEADPEYQIAQRFIKALTSYRAWKDGK